MHGATSANSKGAKQQSACEYRNIAVPFAISPKLCFDFISAKIASIETKKHAYTLYPHNVGELTDLKTVHDIGKIPHGNLHTIACFGLNK